MRTPPQWQESTRPGLQVFAKGGTEEFGAVRGVCPGGRLELQVFIENGGDHCLPVDAILDVHDDKVTVDVARLAPDLRSAIARAHDAEVRGL